MRGHPLFDLEQKRKRQQCDSDLDMLARARFERIAQFEQQVTFFLARYPGQGRGLAGASKRYGDVCGAFLRTQVPKQGEDATRAVRMLAKLRDWLGLGGSSEDAARDLLEKAMIKPASRGDWALWLVQAWPNAGRRVADNLVWACSLREPDLVAQRDDWRATLYQLIGLRLELQDAEGTASVIKPAPKRSLLIIDQLWRATDRAWVPSEAQMDQLTALHAQCDIDSGSDGQRIDEFMAYMRRHRLGQLVGPEAGGAAPASGRAPRM